MTRLNKDKKKEHYVERKDTQRNRKVRKKNWSEGRYCEECFYSLKESEEVHTSCFAASKEFGRKINPNMMKILKERKKGVAP